MNVYKCKFIVISILHDIRGNILVEIFKTISFYTKKQIILQLTTKFHLFW